MSYAKKGLLGNKDGYRETKGGGYSADVSTFIGRSTLHVVVVLGSAQWRCRSQAHLEHVGHDTDSESKGAVTRSWHHSRSSQGLGACSGDGLASSRSSIRGGGRGGCRGRGGRIFLGEGRRSNGTAEVANVLLAVILEPGALGVFGNALGQELVANKGGHSLSVVL